MPMSSFASSGSVAPIDPTKIRVPRPSASNKFTSNSDAASYWLRFGLNVIPIAPGTKKTPLTWDPWLDGLSQEKVTDHWSKNPKHEVGFIVGDDIIVFDADSPESAVALAMLEEAFDITPNMVVKTTKGVHHYFKRAKGSYAKSGSHSTQDYPDRLDIKAGRSLVVLPPSTGKSLDIDEAENAGDLIEVSQVFIDAVYRHNGSPVPRPVETAPSQRVAAEPSSLKIARLKALLDFLAPNVGYEDWYRCGMVVCHETDGSDEGLDLFDTWSSKCNKYKGRQEIESKWRSFKPDQEHPVTIGTLIKMVEDKGGDWLAVCEAAEPKFERCDFQVIHPNAPSTNEGKVSSKPIDTSPLSGKSDPIENCAKQSAGENRKDGTPLDKFSLRGTSSDLEMSIVDSVPVLGELALLGQGTVFFAAPNTGKTVITLSLLIDAVKDRRVDPSKLYYLNMDDTGQGLLEKVRVAEEYNFHMLAEGYRNFSATAFLGIVRDMIEDDQARDVVIVLDTLKKFVDLMDKGRTSTFTNVIRPFVMKGGTVIALAHTNKHPGRDGKPIYGGVSDIMNDIDCAYTIAPVSDQEGRKVVEFANIKRRGSVVERAAYSYCVGNKIPYDEILLSVQQVDQNELDPLKLVEAIKSDAEVIRAVSACIDAGINTKMKLADATAKRAGVSKRAALQVIEKYTGDDPAAHRWKFSVHERGAKIFVRLESASSAPGMENPKI